MKTDHQNQFEQLLRLTEKPDGGQFPESEIERFAIYYQLVIKWNPRLHLTTITDPREFLDRHILESSFAESHLIRSITEIWDLGTGLGIPGIPIAILRPEARVTLVEANRSKSVFLDEAAFALGLSNVKVINARFETLGQAPEGSGITARAVEKMEKVVGKMIELGARSSQLLFFGSADLADRINRVAEHGWLIEQFLLPHSVNNFLIVLKPRKRLEEPVLTRST